MKIEQRKTDSLIPYARNARTHNESQVQQIAGSIAEFGFTNPVLIDGADGIIAGHGRVMAATLLKMEEVPCIRLGHLTEAQKQAYILADNKLALNAGWDDELLKIELVELRDIDPALMAITGFSDDELSELAGIEAPEGDEDAEPQTDRAEELAEEWGTAAGQVWALGDHRLMCGDSTNAEDVGKCLDGAKPFLMVTDPPYGVEYDANWRNEAERADGSKIGASAVGKVRNDDKADWTEAWELSPASVCYVYHASLFTDVVKASLYSAKFEMRNLIIWAKNNFAISRGHYHHKHEPCWYGVKKGATGKWAADKSQTTLWEIDKPQRSETGHSTQKPVECMARPIRHHGGKDDDIYEPFSGSGTTIIAAEQLGRKCYAMEISPGYVAVALQRYEDATGKKPVLIE